MTLSVAHFIATSLARFEKVVALIFAGVAQ